MPPRRPTVLLALAFFALLFASLRGGADYPRYLEWARVFASGDLFALPGTELSPLGVPFSQWSPGTGALFAIPSFLTGELLAATRSARIAGACATVVFWCAMASVIRRAVHGDRNLLLLGLAALFLGMHPGHESIAAASELFALAALAAMLFLGFTEKQWSALDALGFGCAAGFLLFVRPQLAPYAAAVGAASFLFRTSSRPIPGALAVIPCALAVAMVALSNRWMTGSPWRSPYLFGDEDFRSLDFARPQIGAVLAHAWHGLLTYHPLYALGGVALVLHARRPRVRVVLVLFGAVLLLHFYMQASWFCWWLGLATFGMRGLAVASVVLILPLVRVIGEKERRGPWFVAVAVASVWSCLLLWRGETSFATWGEVLESQLSVVTSPAFFIPAAAIVLTAARVNLETAVANSLGALVFVTLARRTAILMLNLPAQERWAHAALGACVGVAATLLLSRATDLSFRAPTRPIALAIVAAFAISTVEFARVAIRAEGNLAPNPRGAVVRLSALQDAIEEYDRVAGFDEEKERLRAYLARVKSQR